VTGQTTASSVPPATFSASATPPPPAGPAPASAGAPAATSADDVTSVDEGRRALDEIDATLRRLVATRREISHKIQKLRVQEGGPRIQHSRENEIIAAYSDELGPRGVDIALAVLTLCRGSLTQS
jgi:chorismate mutase